MAEPKEEEEQHHKRTAEETPPTGGGGGGAGAGEGGAEEEEEVELFSAESLTTPSPASTVHLSSSLGSPRRCVSRELLEHMPALSISTRYYEVAITKPFGAFHLMQLIEKSIQVGALFSPKLYVPREIWQQHRVKLAGVPFKVEVFQSLKSGIEKITMLLPLSSPEAKQVFLKEFDSFLDAAKVERVHLTRSFPFIPIEKHAAVPTAGGSVPKQAESAPTNPPGTNAATAGIGKLTNLAVGFGRMVKKQAIAAVERVGAAQAVTVSFDELEEYAATLCMFFNSTRNLEHLIGLRAGADGTQEEINVVAESSELDAEVMDRLKDLAIFLDEVVVEMVMRDVQVLLETFLRRTTQQFGEFAVEQSLLRATARSSSLSA